MAERFPTQSISVVPTPATWREDPYGEPGVLAPMQSGAPDSRGRYTQALTTYRFTYNHICLTEQQLIRNHYDDSIGDTFEFRSPTPGQTVDLEVRYMAKTTFGRESKDYTKWWAKVAFLGKEVQKMRIERISVEDLGAGVDISSRPVFVSPSLAITLSAVGILTQGAPAGVDDSNTVVIAIKDDGGNTIVSKTYNTANQPPSSDYADLGALSASYSPLLAAEHVTLSVTQGATANMPAFDLILEYYYSD